ncbi:erythromycin esterase family protein [Actinomycetospora endophytica]|uniref:Erythromycin esterase family protein n=1 Tax=Actinomycetospora endophytica TaxID=2291215 RepID=A0ABS8P2Z5_9PSEU|nr:erythromycin esterase family protein [Actinomycetospora endophytica]MCD2192337.1 erythromycin esterase family protein [Actinomycetospora endophytica]
MDDEVVAWLTEHAMPVDPDGLSSWRPSLADVRVLGIGAAAHGARELLEVGRRLVQYAVEDLGARVVVLGASESGATAVDAAVRGSGVPGDAVRALGGWEYDTHEVVNLVSWLRDHNELLAPSEQVRVLGADAVRGAASVRSLATFCHATAPDLLPDVRDSLAELLDHEPSVRTLKPRVRDDVVGLHERMIAEEARLVAESTPEGYAEALHHAEILSRIAEVACAPTGREPRDGEPEEPLTSGNQPVLRARFAAEAVERAARDRSGTPAVVFWGHDDQVRVGDPGTAGRHLRAAFGQAYYAVGGLFGEGGASAVKIRPLNATRPRPTTHKLRRLDGTVEDDLRTVLGDGGERLVDLRAARDADGAVSEWTWTPALTRRLGLQLDSADRRTRTPIVPAAEFDAFTHVARVQPAWIR